MILVGAGPGDPELLTLKAVQALQSADVVLVDDLVDRRVLQHLRPGVPVIAVGKRGGMLGTRRSTPQSQIDPLLLAEARAGRVVVRLKGGDPFLFGRGGEEAAKLRSAGIDVEVIPGVTSGIAAPMAAGISVTDRDTSPGVIFVTGHEKEGHTERVDWHALAHCGLTLVIYMGILNAAKIQRHLLDAGLDPVTAVAAIESATLPGQRVVTMTLERMAAELLAQQVSSPAILVIGAAARGALGPGAAIDPVSAGPGCTSSGSASSS